MVEKAKLLVENKKLAEQMGTKAFKESKKYALKDYLIKIEKELI